MLEAFKATFLFKAVNQAILRTLDVSIKRRKRPIRIDFNRLATCNHRRFEVVVSKVTRQNPEEFDFPEEVFALPIAPHDTRVSSLQLRIPTLCQGSYFPSFREPCKDKHTSLTSHPRIFYHACGVDLAEQDADTHLIQN
ncbi:hypothetical protein GD604_14575 [Desulfolutivibrio sulfoxidireducens]|nr:hypothetical protein GD604_14575 [Desulfolutivibrio sulfoxidireducens]